MSWNRPPPRSKQYEGEHPSTPRAPALRIDDGRARAHVAVRPIISLPKTPNRKSQAIRDSARGEECQVRIVGACTHDNTMTIWSHAPLQAAGKGGQIKSLDLCGAYACTACDAVVDGQKPMPPGASRTSIMNDWFMGHMRSLVILRQKGLL